MSQTIETTMPSKAERKARFEADQKAARIRREIGRAIHAEQMARHLVNEQRRAVGIDRRFDEQVRRNIRLMQAQRAYRDGRRDYLMNLLRLYELWRERVGRPIAYVHMPSEQGRAA
jgi:hypothetical protein